MADHLDEGLAPPAGDVRIDITDVYAFHPPAGAGRHLGKVVLAMGVNPLSLGRTFRPDARYEFVIDTNGDAMEDIVFRLTFSKPNREGQQRVKLEQTMGFDRRQDRDDDDDDDDDHDDEDHDDDDDRRRVLGRGRTEHIIKLRGGGKLFAGIRDDPFFFDLTAFLHGLSFCNPANGDFFAGKNVSAIVVELPRKRVGRGPIGVWGRTLIPLNDVMTQVERMGRPAINTVFMPSNLKQQFNRGQPKDDPALYTDIVKGVLKALGHYDDDAAGAIAAILLPDILTFDTTKTSGFLNGRNLEDDVIDAELKIVTNNPNATDCVDANDKAFLKKFP